jgi:hypothetical protein
VYGGWRTYLGLLEYSMSSILSIESASIAKNLQKLLFLILMAYCLPFEKPLSYKYGWVTHCQKNCHQGQGVAPQ